MAFEQKPGSGALFKNDKGDNPNRPDYRGDATLQDGSKVRISGWLKDGQKGKFLSLKIEPEQERQRDDFRSGGSERVAGGGGRGSARDYSQEFPMDDDIPF